MSLWLNFTRSGGLLEKCLTRNSNYLTNKQHKIMEKEKKITAPYGCEIEKVEIVDGVAVVTFREKDRKLPKTWEEVCENYLIKAGEAYIRDDCGVDNVNRGKRCNITDRNILPDRATAEAVLALCQLIQLRNAYNGDWVPDWVCHCHNYVIEFDGGYIDLCIRGTVSSSPLYFKSRELCDEFLRNFRPLIEKLKPLYGIKEGGEQ